MNLKTALVALIISMLLASLAMGVNVVKADSNDFMSYPGGVTIYSPVNTTYNSNFLTLNVSLGEGVRCSLNYSIDGNYGGPIPLTFGNTTGFQLISLASGLVQLPKLSEGSHRLTIYEEAYLNDYHGANPPGAPFKPTSPGSADYYAAWVDAVNFAINSGTLTQTPAPLEESAPTITILSIENKTYTTPDIH
ncbi:MAG: hypothetical protein ABSD42_07530 [Candidatus Bathyarchaeia archaeon]|jgi:hypothetical protein